MAFRPTPKRKADELLHRVEKIATAIVVDELDLQRIGSEARKLMAVDAQGAHATLGTLAAVRGDPQDTKEHYEIALNLDRGPTTWFNYSMSLAILDEHEASLDVAKEGLNAHPDNLELVERAADAAMESGSFVDAEAFCRHRDALKSPWEYGLRDRVRSLAAAVEAGRMTEPAAKALIAALTKVQRERGMRTLSAEMTVFEDTFLYERWLRCTPAVAAELNWQFAGVMAERTDLTEDPGAVLISGFVGAVDGSHP